MPLAENVLTRALDRELPVAEVTFNYCDRAGKVSILEPLIGQSGWLRLSQFSIESFDQSEDRLLFAAVTDAGLALDQEIANRLLSLPGNTGLSADAPDEVIHLLDGETAQQQQVVQREVSERNALYFEAEAAKLDGWADDLKLGLEREIKEIDRQIKDTRRAATTALTLEEKLAGQKQIKGLEALRNQKRRSLFDAQDEIDNQREQLIAQIEGKLEQKTELQLLFTIRWRLV